MKYLKSFNERVSAGYWNNYENCEKEALKYQTRSEFSKKNTSAYQAAYRNGWLDSICKHMYSKLKPIGHWTKQNCEKEALKYQTRTEFSKKNSHVYKIASRNGWLDDICINMQSSQRKSGHWNYESVMDAAKECKTRVEFHAKYGGAYDKALDNGWLKDVNNILPAADFNSYKRFIYAYEFPDNYVYVGLTWNVEMRNYQHLYLSRNSAVFNHIQKTGLQPKLLIKTKEPIVCEEAIKMEEIVLLNYIDNNWNILNRRKTGGLGGGGRAIRKFSDNVCKEEAQKYKTRIDFRDKSPEIYKYAMRYKMLDTICAHMKE